MPPASAERLRFLAPTPDGRNYLNHAFLQGAVIDVQAGDAVTGGRDFDEIAVANTNDAGAGSLRQAIADAKTAGGGTITFSLSGTATILSDLTIQDVPNLTIDGRGQAFTVAGTRQIFLDDSAGNGGCPNLILMNFEIARVGGGATRDAIRAFQHNLFDATPWFFAFLLFTGFSDANADETLNLGIGAPVSHTDQAVVWCRWDNTTDHGILCNDRNGWSPGDSANCHLDLHHNYWDDVFSRTPLWGANEGAASNLGAFMASHNNVRNGWALGGGGGAAREGAMGWFEQDWFFFDGDDGDGRHEMGAFPGGGPAPAWGDGKVKVVDPVESSTGATPPLYHEQDEDEVTDPRDIWPTYTVCTMNGAEKAFIDDMSGFSVQMESSGTLDGLDEENVIGATFDLTLPSIQSWVAAGAAFNAVRANIRANVIIWEPSTGSVLPGTDVFTQDTDVTRTDAQNIRLTASADPGLSADAVFFYQGADGITSGDFLSTWNYADVAVVIPAAVGQVVLQA